MASSNDHDYRSLNSVVGFGETRLAFVVLTELACSIFHVAGVGGGLRIAIPFCRYPKHEGCKDENSYSLFCWSEAESLSRFSELETPVVLNHE